MYKIYFYAPESHVEIIKNALFATGAGRIGDYAACAWQVLGEGQFIPLEHSAPFEGTPLHLSKVAEYKVELVCTPACLQAAIKALKETHPYETPAYGVIALENH